MKNISKETIIRTIVMVAALINQVLTFLNINPIPFSSEEIYAALTSAFTVISTIWVWWKNNSFTKNAIEADAYLNDLKKGASSDV